MNKKTYTDYDGLPLTISVPEMAVVLGISRAGAYELARSKDFPSIKIGTRIVIPKTQLIEWISRKLTEKEEIIQ